MSTIIILINSIFSTDHVKGTDHWLAQRVTSLAMLPLTCIFFIFFFMNFGLEYDQVRSYFTQPFVNTLTIVFLLVTSLHVKQGLEVVIEDYISEKGKRNKIKVINTTVCILMALSSTVSLLSLYFVGN